MMHLLVVRQHDAAGSTVCATRSAPSPSRRCPDAGSAPRPTARRRWSRWARPRSRRRSGCWPRWSAPTDIRSSIMLDVAAAHHDVVEREALEDLRGRRARRRLRSSACSRPRNRLRIIGASASRQPVAAMSVMKPRRPVVDADQRDAVARELAADAQHRAVAADHHREVADLRELVDAHRAVVDPVAVHRGVMIDRHLDAAVAPGTARSPPAWAERPGPGTCRRAPRDGRGSTCDELHHTTPAAAWPSTLPNRALRAARAPSLSYNRTHARRARQDTAEDPGRTLHRRRPARGLAHACRARRGWSCRRPPSAT